MLKFANVITQQREITFHEMPFMQSIFLLYVHLKFGTFQYISKGFIVKKCDGAKIWSDLKTVLGGAKMIRASSTCMQSLVAVHAAWWREVEKYRVFWPSVCVTFGPKNACYIEVCSFQKLYCRRLLTDFIAVFCVFRRWNSCSSHVQSREICR